MTNKPRRILTFGTFDGLHQGHRFFLRQAKTRGDELVVAVARDLHVKILKGRVPEHVESKRLEAVQKLRFVDDARLCDRDLGSFLLVSEVDPDIIVLGHDQMELEQDIHRWMSEKEIYIPVMRIKKYEASKRA